MLITVTEKHGGNQPHFCLFLPPANPVGHGAGNNFQKNCFSAKKIIAIKDFYMYNASTNNKD